MSLNRSVKDYSFRYHGFMDTAIQSLPIGNGDIGANVWITQDGTVHILISKTDTFSELYRLLKPAHISLSIKPSPFKNGADFELNIDEGFLTIATSQATLYIYADAWAPCIRLKLITDLPSESRLDFINYRDRSIDPQDDFSNYFMRGGKYEIKESADILSVTPAGGISQVHRNSESCYEFSLRNQDMESYIGKERDPLLGLTFGAAIYSNDMLIDDVSLVGKELSVLNASIFVKSIFTKTSSDLLRCFDMLYKEYGDDDEESFNAHKLSWKSFWKNSYIYVEGDDDAEQITKAFLYQRYIIRCADRGNSPMKFNGLIFTADQMKNYPENYDARRWGAAYWIQNTRIMYWYLLYIGDYESMLPMFDMFINMMPISIERCNSYFGHKGMLIPETVSFFGLYANSNYGFMNDDGNRRGDKSVAIRRGEAANRYIRYHYNGMLEISWMMLKYLELSGDNSRRTKMLSFIEQSLLFFDCHFDRIDGKMMINPVSSLETWQLCVNDAPDIAGLSAICNKLKMFADIPDTLMTLVEDLLPAIPDLPKTVINNHTVLAPCEIKLQKSSKNLENPELYAVFPYCLYGLNKHDLETARSTYFNRSYSLDKGWSQDPVDAALLGLVNEAERHLIRQVKMTDPRAIFPAFWGPNFDETPDQDHGCMTSLCLIFMLLQTEQNNYTAFPAWPKKWNVSFKLPLNNTTSIVGKQLNGIRTVIIEDRTTI